MTAKMGLEGIEDEEGGMFFCMAMRVSPARGENLGKPVIAKEEEISITSEGFAAPEFNVRLEVRSGLLPTV